MTRSARSTTEARSACSIYEALGSSLDLREALERAYPLLLCAISADYAALGMISKVGASEASDWILAKMPDSFFAAYEQMAPYDFVRRAVAKRPNVVLRDHEMVPRAVLESNAMYRRAREVGAPMECVMSVMLHIDGTWLSGLSLCRERRRPFSERDARRLTAVVPAIANAVRNSQLFGAAMEWNSALSGLLENQGVSAVLVSASGHVVECSVHARRLLEKWFPSHERRNGCLPDALGKFLRESMFSDPERWERSPWMKRASDTVLTVSLVRVPPYNGAARARAVLLLREEKDRPALPATWRSRLSAREHAVVAGVLKGWDNRVIAAELGCAVGTVKKHLQNVFDKTGVASRTAFVARVLHEQAR